MMTVGELIEALKDFDKSLPVTISLYSPVDYSGCTDYADKVSVDERMFTGKLDSNSKGIYERVVRIS